MPGGQLLQMDSIRKEFPGVVALDNLNLCLEGGKVNVIMGKNGSGKSTLVNIISGLYAPTSGKMILNNNHLNFSNPREALEFGVATVHQELSLVPTMSIAENIFVGRLPQKKNGLVDYKQLKQKTSELLESINIQIDPETIVNKLSIGLQQQVEIAKACAFAPKVLLLDEPTSALLNKEVDLLFQLIRKIKETGCIIVYVSHRIQELQHIADIVHAIRDGEYVASLSKEEISAEAVVQLMFGENTGYLTPQHFDNDGDTVLEVQNLADGERLKDISFSVKRGDVLGIAGLLGSGRTEILQMIYGLRAAKSGKISLFGNEIKNASPHVMARAGVMLTSENRKEEGVIQVMSVGRSLCLAGMKKIASKICNIITAKRERPFARKQIDSLQIKCEESNSISNLSGGNQQKVVIGNLLNNVPQIILFDEPTRGIDVQAKFQVFSIIRELSKNGISSVIVSSELEDLPEVCNRIIVLKDGIISDEVNLFDLKKAEDLYHICMV